MHSIAIAENASKLWVNPVRCAILKSILSRENASTGKEILADFPKEERSNVSNHLDILVRAQIVYRQENYITNRGFFYSIHWSDLAQKAVDVVENAGEKPPKPEESQTYIRVSALLLDAPELSAAEIGRFLSISRQRAWVYKRRFREAQNEHSTAS
jgi:hypothetical protein